MILWCGLWYDGMYRVPYCTIPHIWNCRAKWECDLPHSVLALLLSVNDFLHCSVNSDLVLRLTWHHSRLAILSSEEPRKFVLRKENRSTREAEAETRLIERTATHLQLPNEAERRTPTLSAVATTEVRKKHFRFLEVLTQKRKVAPDHTISSPVWTEFSTSSAGHQMPLITAIPDNRTVTNLISIVEYREADPSFRNRGIAAIKVSTTTTPQSRLFCF